MHVARVISISCVLSAWSVADGQTFARYLMDGVNITDQDRGTHDAAVGDVIRMSMRVEHDGASYAGGKVEFLSTGVPGDSIIVSEDEADLIFDPWEVGRTFLARIVVSDGPADTIFPFNEEVIAFDDGTVTDVNGDFIDLATTPPGLGGLVGAFPISDGDAIFVVDYVYGGGVDLWDAGHNGRARLWRDSQDINGIEVPASSGATFVVSPSPGAVGVFVLAGAFGARRRR